ncbi:MAG: copper resistance CopC family protein [Actinomycetota bacterium]
MQTRGTGSYDGISAGGPLCGTSRRNRRCLLTRECGFASKSCLLLAIVALSLPMPSAAAHGLLKKANPAPDVDLARIPQTVSVTLTQPPMPNGKLTVRDGCGRVVSEGSNVDDDTITADVSSARPGRWRVRFDFVSATDGHRYGSSYSFTVKGERDCGQDQEGQERKEGMAEEGEEREERDMGSGDRSDDDMASGSESGDHSDGQSIPVGGLVAASAIAFATGLIARLRPRMR